MELVIFSSTLSLAALFTALGLYLLTAVARIVFKNSGVITAILGILNLIDHLAIFALCLYLKASAQEMLFVLVISTALALTVTRLGEEKEG